MIYDYLIVGQGIAGSMVAYHALKRGKNILVIDQSNPRSASNITTGVINPITGRRMSKTWIIDTLIPYARSLYQAIEEEYKIEIFFEQPMLRIFSSEVDVEEWNSKRQTKEYCNYLGNVQQNYNPSAIQPYGAGEILQSFRVDIPLFIRTFRTFLQTSNRLLETAFNYEDVQFSDGINYKAIQAERIIFCEGYKAIHNPFFSSVPLSHAKGELLEILAPGLNVRTVLNKNIFISPLGDDKYLVGSTFIWDDTEEKVTDKGRNEITDKLDKMINVPYKIIKEKAGIRPTMPDRRPALGSSKDNENVYMLNGFGTKGISLAPFFSNHLLEHIELGNSLLPECDIRRFKKKNYIR